MFSSFFYSQKNILYKNTAEVEKKKKKKKKKFN